MTDFSDKGPMNLPCGCKIVALMHEGEKTFAIEACSLDCEHVRFAMSKTKEDGKPMRFASGRIGSDGKIYEDGSAA